VTDVLDIPPALDRASPAWGPMNKLPPFTYTGLNLYDDICPHQFYRKFIKKDIKFVQTPQMEAGNVAHRALELRIGRGVPLPGALAHIEPLVAPFDGKGAKTEVKLGLTAAGGTTGHFSDDTAGRCRIDVYMLSGTSAYLIDHKTGSVREDPFELEIQGLFLKARYHQIETIKAKYLWIKEKRFGQVHDVSDTKRTWARVTGIMERMKKEPAVGGWEKTPGPLCGWCDVIDCEHRRERKK
jgi:hypothetical protein